LLTDKGLRRTALRGLAAYADAATPKRVLAVFGDLSPDEKQDAVATLSSRKEYALALLDAVERKAVARTDISAYVARQLYALGDKEVTGRLREVWGDIRDTAPDKQKQLARYKAMLTPGYLSRADLGNGRLVFSKTCQQCHTLYGEGGKIGPDLTGSNRANLDYILSNILDPSAEVAQDYRMSVVMTKAGRFLTGMIVERTPNRITLQTATERLVIAREDVASVRDSPQSMMPEGQLDALTKEQVRDLIAYLAGKTQVLLPVPSRDQK
jgi:putative heme-binding domain-containing protein